MRYTLLLLSFIIFSINFFAQTIIPGGLVRGQWKKANSPYLVQNAIMIANDSTLTIEPGVKVEFQGQYKFLVLGKLLAVGTVQDSIIFTTANHSTGWLGIRFENTTSNNDTTRLSYCKVEYGKADGVAPNDCGGGIYFDHFSKAVISNTSVFNCYADINGGGIYCGYSSPVILNNKIMYNSVLHGNGGGICCENYSDVTIIGNTISGNTARGNGGGIGNFQNWNSLIANNSVSYNSISSSGGGGGIINVANSTTITGNTIFNNSASNGTGGGIYDGGLGAWSGAVITSNFISNNIAMTGGGFYCNGDALPVINNVIANNTAFSSGGGIACENNCQALITNNTITNNAAPNGGGMFFTVMSSPTIKNCIIWGNTETADGPQVFLDDESSDPNFYYCDIMNGPLAIGVNSNVFYLGNYSNNISNNPFFVSPAAGSGTGYNALLNDWNLQVSSPCINIGDPVGPYPATDILGNTRIVGTRIDIGAFESSVIDGLRNENKNELISVFPNPFNSQATILLNENRAGCTLGIIDVLGREIEKSNISEKQLVIDKGTKQPGIYFINVNDSQGQLLFRKKIIIQ